MRKAGVSGSSTVPVTHAEALAPAKLASGEVSFEVAFARCAASR